jgi:4-amino-4-deoxy-L-arabinose transferase-like glycosyltransferase
VPWTFLVLLPLVAGTGLAAVNRRRLAASRLALASAAWIVVAVVLVAFQGRFYAHYAAPMTIPMALLAGLGLDGAVRATTSGTRRTLLAAPLILAIGIALAVGAAGAAQEQAPIRASNERAAQVASVLRSSTDPAASIFVWGNDARVYELAARRPASRYVYLYPLLTPGYATAERIASVEAELAADRPAAFIDSGSLEPGAPGLPPLLIERPVATDGRDVDLLGPLRALVRSGYVAADDGASWLIYLASRP